MTDPRPAQPDDLEPLTRIWHDGWAEAHAEFVPATLLARRTLDSFRVRLSDFGNAIRTAGPVGAPLGLCVARNDELDQLYVAPNARGSGLAASLLADGEARLSAQGTKRAFLLCLIENTRAAGFYERFGWENLGPRADVVETLDEPFPLEVLRFEKTLV